MSDNTHALDQARRLLREAAQSGEGDLIASAVHDALMLIHSEVVRAHIGIIRSRCGADAALAVAICSALGETSAYRLQRWARLAEARSDLLD